MPAVFLDRDGTIIEEVGYLCHLNQVAVFPWTVEAIRRLNESGLPAIVVTNQSGVARGYFTEELVQQVHQKILRELASQDARLETFYYCPHHPDGSVAPYRKECRCRKPATGLVEEAARRFGIDLRSSYVVGDSYRDVELGLNVGARTILLLTGYGRKQYELHRDDGPRQPHLVVENLLDAVSKILEDKAARLGPGM